MGFPVADETSTGAADAPAGPAGPSRPTTVTVAAVLLIVAGVLAWLFAAALAVLRLGEDYGGAVLAYVVLIPALTQFLLGAVAMLAAALVLVGREGGRALGFAVCGVACLLGFDAALYVVVDLFTAAYRGPTGYLIYFGWLAEAALAIAVVPLLLNRVAADWFHHRRLARGGVPVPQPAGVPDPPLS